MPVFRAFRRITTVSSTVTSKDGFMRLQNGSDVRGVAADLGHADVEPITLTPGRAYFIGRAFARWASEKTGARLSPQAAAADRLRICVGLDPRVSGPALSAALCAGAASVGALVLDVGLSTTPAMFMATVLDGDRAVDAYRGGAASDAPGGAGAGAPVANPGSPSRPYHAGVMLTASHLPANRNGAKFFLRTGGLASSDIRALLESARNEAAAHAASTDPRGLVPDLDHQAAALVGAVSAASAGGAVERAPGAAVAAYSRHLERLVVDGVGAGDAPLAGWKVVVDPGNGSAGFLATTFERLGADTRGSQCLEPDGTFPNHVPNPEDREAMASAAAAVAAASADLGVVLDTDADRSGLVGPDGREVNRNRLIAALSAVVLAERPGATIVTDSVTSAGLARFIAAKGGRHVRFRRGYKNVIQRGVDEAAAGFDCPLMIETSGHGAMDENYYLDDGAYLAIKLLVHMARTAREARWGGWGRGGAEEGGCVWGRKGDLRWGHAVGAPPLPTSDPPAPPLVLVADGRVRQ